MQNLFSPILSSSARQGSLHRSHSLSVCLSLLALTCWGATPIAQSECREGCDLTLNNTFLGDEALDSNTTGFSNTAVGNVAMQANTTGFFNTATGFGALGDNTTGSWNTATGWAALGSN